MNPVEHQPRLFFDIETIADPAQFGLIEEPAAPSNYKDPDKIAVYVAEKKAKLVERAGLDPDTGRVHAIAMCIDRGPMEVMTSFKVPEVDMLTKFWSWFRTVSGHCAGYNIIRFDLPFLLRRSMALRVKVGIEVDLRKYRVEPTTDLMAILYGGDIDSTKGLKWVAGRYGIQRDPQLASIDGSMVKDLDEQTLEAYVAEDVRTVMDLFDKMNSIYFNL